jgi:hypothetical protein
MRILSPEEIEGVLHSKNWDNPDDLQDAMLAKQAEVSYALGQEDAAVSIFGEITADPDLDLDWASNKTRQNHSQVYQSQILREGVGNDANND